MRQHNAESVVRILGGVLVGIVLLSSLVAGSSTVAFPPGIKTGDWATYTEIHAVFGDQALLRNYPGGSMGALNSSAFPIVNIVSASSDSPIISFTTTAHFANSTGPLPTTQSYALNLTQGWGVNEPPFIIAANRAQYTFPGMDSLLPLNYTVAETLNLTVPGSSVSVKLARYINYLSYTSIIFNGTDSNYNVTSHIRYRWDKITGAPVGIFIQGTVLQNGQTASYTYGLTMTSTSMWAYAPTPPPPGSTFNPQPTIGPSSLWFGLQFGELYVLLSLAGVVVMGVVAVVWRRLSGNDKGRTNGIVPVNKRQAGRGAKRKKTE